jgi:hypothetical protein
LEYDRQNDRWAVFAELAGYIQKLSRQVAGFLEFFRADNSTWTKARGTMPVTGLGGRR